MIYVGHYKEGMKTADDVFPELSRMCEADMREFAARHRHELSGVYVNRCYMMDAFEAKDIMVMPKNGFPFFLSEHKQWKMWEKAMTPSEFYTNLNLD